MSLASHRAALVDALAPVEGVDAHPRFVSATAPGTCYPRLERIEHPDPFGGVAYWNVVVVLPQDYDAAELWVEDHVDPLRAAVGDVLTVTTVVPQRLDTGAGILPALFINGYRAEQD